MKDFIRSLEKGTGAAFLTDYEKYQNLSKEDFRRIALELIIAIDLNSNITKDDKLEIMSDTADELKDYLG
jgi:hypothetical protein